MFPGISTGGGGLSSSSSAESKSGPINVGGLTFNPPQKDMIEKAIMLTGLGVLILFAMRRGK